MRLSKFSLLASLVTIVAVDALHSSSSNSHARRSLNVRTGGNGPANVGSFGKRQLGLGLNLSIRKCTTFHWPLLSFVLSHAIQVAV